MMYGNYFWGMNFVWWLIWAMMLVWIFVIPYDIPGQRRQPSSPFDVLRMRLANGQITSEQYQEHKRVLEADFLKP